MKTPEEEVIEFIDGINRNVRAEMLQYFRDVNMTLHIPIYFQLGLLGLTDSDIVSYISRKAKGLDIGCGEGVLVEHLRERGFEFEGIDAESSIKPYLMKQLITNMRPVSMYGSIPREDNSYDLAISFQNGSLNRGFTFGGVIRDPTRIGGNRAQIEEHTSIVMFSQFVVYEGLRVLKPNSRFVAYPALSRLEEVIGPMLRMQGIEFFHEDVDPDLTREYSKWELSHYGFDGEIPKKYNEVMGLLQRTVLMKKS